MFLRRVFNPDCKGFEVGIDETDPMKLIIGSGTIRDRVINATSISIPVRDVGQNVSVCLYDYEDYPIQTFVYTSDSDPDFPTEQAILMLTNCFVPPNCSSLKDIDVYVYGFVDDKLYETPFDGSEVIWEVV